MHAFRAIFPFVVAGLLCLPIAQGNHIQTRSDSGATVSVQFDHVGANEWWVEVRILGPSDDSVILVYARAEGEAWHALQLIGQQDGWDKWVTNSQDIFRVAPGKRVQFQGAVLDDRTGQQLVVRSCFFTHPAGQEQCDPGSTDPLRATFRNPGGNEWWLQVFVDANHRVDGAFAEIFTDLGESIHGLQKRSWGAWAASHHAPAGSVVRFTAFSGLEEQRSGCYEWPAAAPSTCPAPRQSPEDATFDHRGGNEWWVEAVVGPGGPHQFQARDPGGPWVDLEFRDWGTYAASFHIEAGHPVQFRARYAFTWFESCWFTHPAGLSPEGAQTCKWTTRYGA